MTETIGKERWKLRGITYIVPKCYERWFTDDEKWDPHFYPPSEISAFFVIAELRTRSSADRTQPNFGGKPRQQTAVTNFWVFRVAKNWGPKTVDLFSTTPQVEGNFECEDLQHGTS